MTVKEKRGLDMSKLSNRKKKTVATKEALKHITPIKWSSDTITGKKQIRVTKAK